MLFLFNQFKLFKIMKINKIPALLALVLTFALWSCQPDTVAPKESSNDAASLLADAGAAHPDPSPVCSDRITFNLIEETTGTNQVNYCGFLPCNGTEPSWGTVEVLNSDVALYLNVTMAFGWYVELGESYLGLESDMDWVNGIPKVENNWIQTGINPIVNKAQIVIPVNNLPTCFDVANRISVVRLDFFTGVDQASRTSLWLQDNSTTGSGSPFVTNWCFSSCGPQITTVTGGNCSGCESSNTVDFIDCDTVDVSSCKDLSNVVLVYTDGAHQKFDGLSGYDGTFYGIGANSGKEISHVYVKSGCYQSGEGPGYGRRFDGPCYNGTSTPPSNSGGTVGGNGNGGNGNGNGNGNGGGKGKGKNK